MKNQIFLPESLRIVRMKLRIGSGRNGIKTGLKTEKLTRNTLFLNLTVGTNVLSIYYR